MPISIACDCGRTLKVKDEAAGRKVRCPACSKVLVAPMPEPSGNLEDEAINELLAEGPPAPVASVPPPREPAEEKDQGFEEEKRPPMPKPRKNKSLDPTREARLPRIERPERSGGGIAIHPQIIMGVLMMVGALIWFFGALALGVIFWYPPILFVLGIGTVIKGFTGRE